METALSSEGLSMDSLLAIGSSLPAWQASSPASRDADSAPYAPGFPQVSEPLPTQALDSVQGGDPADERQRMLHFISHVDAACFIALLQTMDPMPDDYRARAEYKRYYHQLRESLEVPLPPQDPQPVRLPTDNW